MVYKVFLKKNLIFTRIVTKMKRQAKNRKNVLKSTYLISDISRIYKTVLQLNNNQQQKKNICKRIKLQIDTKRKYTNDNKHMKKSARI